MNYVLQRHRNSEATGSSEMAGRSHQPKVRTQGPEGRVGATEQTQPQPGTSQSRDKGGGCCLPAHHTGLRLCSRMLSPLGAREQEAGTIAHRVQPSVFREGQEKDKEELKVKWTQEIDTPP